MKTLIRRNETIAEQVHTILRRRIRTQEYPPGSRLPAESKLAEEFGVSRTSIRTALATLAAEGAIARKHGDGTYVSNRLIEVNTRLGGIWDFKHWIEDSGRTPIIKVLLVDYRSAQDQELTALDISPPAKVLVIDRLFYADDTPVILSTNVVPVDILIDPEEDFEVRVPIHEFLLRYCDERVSYATTVISAIGATASLEETLGLKPGKPLLQFMDVFYNDNDRPLVAGFNFYHDRALRFRIAHSWG